MRFKATARKRRIRSDSGISMGVAVAARYNEAEGGCHAVIVAERRLGTVE
jgi:hypothetical protein